MSRIRFALAQINPIVGDIAGNSRLIIDAVSEASENSASVVAFPEMALTGYPIEDLAFNRDFVRESMNGVGELARTLHAKGLGDIAVVVGYIRESDETSHGGAIAHNSLAVLFEGDVVEGHHPREPLRDPEHPHGERGGGHRGEGPSSGRWLTW